ncbi:MAG: SPFH domain-containing protein [Clostridiales bacterium]|nr:SPFH domain-containing protein [Clostridiales bacterium]
MAQTVYNVVKYEGGDNSALVTKGEITDFTHETALIVGEAQQAVLFRDGDAEGPFTSGRHILPTNDVSKFKKFFAKLFRRPITNPNAPFSCDVFFVNTVADVPINWGTSSRTLVKDPVYNELVEVGANGNVRIKVSDPMAFVININGKMGGYTLDRLAAHIRGEIMTVIKSHIASAIVNCGVSLLEISARLDVLSHEVEVKLNDRLKDFGIQAVHFNIMDISVDDGSKARLLDRQKKINARADVVQDSAAAVDAETDRIMRIAQARAAARQVEGFTYQEERAWDVQEARAKNPGMGGMPYPYAMPGMMPNMMPGMMPTGGMPYGTAVCANCGNPMQPGAQFCAMCGAVVGQAAAQDTVQPGGRTHTYAAGPRTCPKCGFPLLPRNTVCPGCGFDLESDGE